MRRLLAALCVIGATVAFGAETSRLERLLATLTDDPEPRHRRYAAWAVASLDSGADEPRLVASLVSALDSDDELLRGLVRDALVTRGAGAVPRLVESLAGGARSPAEVDDALVAIGAPAVEDCIALVRSATDPTTRRRAIIVLGRIGPDAAEAGPVLVERLSRRHAPAERAQAAIALGRIGEPVIELLLTLYRDDRSTAEDVFRALGQAGPAASRAVPMLVEALTTAETSRVRFSAAAALGGIGAPAADAVPALIDRLANDRSKTVRFYAARALGEIGERDDVVVPALIEALAQREQGVPSRAVTALARFGAVAAERVSRAADSDDALVREYAAAVLGQLAEAWPPAIDRLIAQLEDPEEPVRDRATLALRQIGTPAVPTLIATLTISESARSRGYTALALGGMEPPPIEALEGLGSALQDDSRELRRIAAWSMGRYGPPAVPYVAELVAALDTTDPVLRRNAVWALGNIGPEAFDTAPRVEALLEDDDEDVREEAREALDKLHERYVRGGQTP